MTLETLKEAEIIREKIKRAKNDLKDIKHYDDSFFIKMRNIKICIPHSFTEDIFYDLDISDIQLKKDILNLIKIHLIRTVQDAEKELESL